MNQFSLKTLPEIPEMRSLPPFEGGRKTVQSFPKVPVVRAGDESILSEDASRNSRNSLPPAIRRWPRKPCNPSRKSRRARQRRAASGGLDMLRTSGSRIRTSPQPRPNCANFANSSLKNHANPFGKSRNSCARSAHSNVGASPAGAIRRFSTEDRANCVAARRGGEPFRQAQGPEPAEGQAWSPTF